ncbi:MAG: M14 family metallocarboxypeptidase [Nitrospinales bacterium]
MNQPKLRDYQTVLTRLNSSVESFGAEVHPILNLTINGSAYPFQKIVIGKGNRRKALISAGIHGDEPAGVETLCAFLEQNHYIHHLPDWEITLLPCLNPFGYEYGTRNNHDDMDLNRLFKSTHFPSELIAIQGVLQEPFDLSLELHEDCDSSGFYLYQKERERPDSEIGRLVLEEVKKIMPINMANEIESQPAFQGLIHRLPHPEEMDWWPMSLFSIVRGVRCCLTLETSSGFPLETRIMTHLAAMRTALDRYPEVFPAWDQAS